MPYNSPDYWKEILYIVSLKEGVYESIQPSQIYQGLTQKTIKEVWEIQRSRKAPRITAAVGRYQFVGDVDDGGASIKTAATRAGLNWETDLFSPINQDKMAIHKIEGFRKVTEDMIRNDPVEAALRLAKEWASLPVLAPTQGAKRQLQRGESFYTGDGLNMAGVTPAQMEGAFARFLKQQPPLTDFRGLAAANETPALTSAGFGDPPTYGDSAAGGGPTSVASYNPAVTQRETPLVSVDEMLDLLRAENRVQNIPATTPRITSQQYSDNRSLDYRANLYSSKNYKQTVLPPRDVFWGIVTDVVTVPKEDLQLRSGQDIMVNYALINDQPDLKPEKVAYVYPLIDQSANMLEYMPDNLDPKSLNVDRAMKYEAIYDRQSVGTEISEKIQKDSIVKIRVKGPNMTMLRIIGVVGAPSTVFANLIGGGTNASGQNYSGGGASGGPGMPPTQSDKSPPGRIVGPIGAEVWVGEEAILTNAERTSIPDICDMSSIPYLATNIVYHYSYNFTDAKIIGYDAPKAWCFCRYLKNFYRVAKKAFDNGYGIILYDAYRPFDAQQGMADWADSIGKPCLYRGEGAKGGCGQMLGKPWGKGSNHNRGAAFDIVLYKIQDGLSIGATVEPLDYGGPFDDILKPASANHNWPGASAEQRRNRTQLESFFSAGGFTTISSEWWHYEIKGGGLSAPISGPEGWIK